MARSSTTSDFSLVGAKSSSAVACGRSATVGSAVSILRCPRDECGYDTERTPPRNERGPAGGESYHDRPRTVHVPIRPRGRSATGGYTPPPHAHRLLRLVGPAQ